MNKRILSRLMHERVSSLRGSGGYFFHDNFQYVLRGVAFEYVPRGLYVWDFRFPLFDFFGPNLLYSIRLNERAGFINKNEMSEEEIVSFVVSSPEAKISLTADKCEDVPEFIRFLESASGLLRNAHARLIHAAALALVDQRSSAMDLLEALAPVLNEKDAASCKLLRESLRQGASAARELLDNVCQQNLRTLGVASA